MTEQANRPDENTSPEINPDSLTSEGNSEECTPIQAEPLIPADAFKKPAAASKPAPGRPIFIAPQTIDRVAFDELSRTLGELIAGAERTNHLLRQTTDHAAAQRLAVKEDITKQKGHIGLVARLLRAVDQRTKELDTIVDRHFAEAGEKVGERLVELEAGLGVRAKDIDAAIERAIARVNQSVGTRQDELQAMAEQLKTEIDNARAKHAAEAQKHVDKAATTLVNSIVARSAELQASIDKAGETAGNALEARSSKAMESIALHTDQCDAALHQTAQGLQAALNERAAASESAIHDRAQQCLSQLKKSLDEANALTSEKLVSVDRFAEQAVARVESRILAKAEQAEVRATAATGLIKDATEAAMGELRSETEQLGEAAASKLEAMGTTAHRELAQAFDDRVNRLETIITARRAQLVDQLDKADARLRLMEKVEQRIEDKASRLLDGLEQRVRERADTILGEAEQRITAHHGAIAQSIHEAEQRHRAVVATLADDADHRIDAYESLFAQARATLGIDPDDPESPALPGSLGDLIVRAGEMLEHLHAATARLAVTRDQARRTSQLDPAALGTVDQRLDAVRHTAAPIKKANPAPSPAETPIHETGSLDDSTDDRDPVLAAIERLRGSVASDLERLTMALHSARRSDMPGESTDSKVTTTRSRQSHAA